MENPIMTPQNEHCSKCIYNNVRQKIVNLLDSLAELATFCAVYVRSVTLYGKIIKCMKAGLSFMR